MKKILITGGSGLLGSNLAQLALEKFEVHTTYCQNKVSFKGVDCFQIDLSQEDNLDLIRTIKPDVMIHSAALTNIDYCEENPQEAHQQNVLASRHVAKLAKEMGAYLIHISTDCVFDGKKGNYSEEDATHPINVYGATKLEAEQAVAEENSSACIVRTNIYGFNKIDKFSLAEWMIDKLTHGQELPGFKDVTVSPILVNDLAEVLFDLSEKQYSGIIHIAGSEATTKLDFAYAICEIYGLDKDLIKPVSYHDVQLKAPRGEDLSLNVSKGQDLLGRTLPDIRTGLTRMKQLQDNNYGNELKNA